VIGRPNVGKSALVNRLCASQSGGAIVADVAGITRDRTYRAGSFMNRDYEVIDTGGLVFDDSEGMFLKEIMEQALIAIEEATCIVMVVDGQAGLNSMDLQVGEFLRRKVLPRYKDVGVVVAVNKCESDQGGNNQAAEFWQLGLGEPRAVSAIHGVGTAELLEEVFGFTPESPKPVKAEEETDEFLLEHGFTQEDLDGMGDEEDVKTIHVDESEEVSTQARLGADGASSVHAATPFVHTASPLCSHRVCGHLRCSTWPSSVARMSASRRS